MDPAQEVHDTKRDAIIRRLEDALEGFPIDSGTWACLWLADIEVVESMLQREKDLLVTLLLVDGEKVKRALMSCK